MKISACAIFSNLIQVKFGKSVIIWKQLIFLLLLLNVMDNNRVQSEIASGNYNYNPVTPAPTIRVFLFSFERGHLLTITEQENSDVILTKAPGYFEAYNLECNATFPVQWVYLGEGSPLATADVARSFRDFFDPSTYMYQASLVMFNLHEQNSGRYVCRGIESQYQKISSFLHLYIPGDDILVSTIEKTVQVQKDKDHITIPCGVSDPTSLLNLYKGNQKGTFKRIETNSSIIYNPRRGFQLYRNSLQDPFGNYLCVSPLSKKRVRVHVVPKDDFKAQYTRTKRGAYENEPFGQSSALQFSYDGRHHRMLCCGTSKVLPKLYFAGCTSIVDCEIKSACFRENRCESRESSLDYNSYYNNYMGLDPHGCVGHSLRTDPHGDFGLFLCSDSINGLTQYQPYLLNRGNLFMSFDKAPPADQVMTLDRTTDEELFVGSESEFRCNASRFFFATGLRWAFERIDGDLEFLEDSEVIRDAFFVNNHRRHSTLRIPHANIKSVVCVAPVWNSATEWRMLNIPIRISQIFNPPDPQFLHLVEESIAKSQYTSPSKSSETAVFHKGIETSSAEQKSKLSQRLLRIHVIRPKSESQQPLTIQVIPQKSESQQPYKIQVIPQKHERRILSVASPFPHITSSSTTTSRNPSTISFTEQPIPLKDFESSTSHLKHIHSLRRFEEKYLKSNFKPQTSSITASTTAPNSQESSYVSYNNHLPNHSHKFHDQLLNENKKGKIWDKTRGNSGSTEIQRPVSVSHQYFYRTINTLRKREVEPAEIPLLSTPDYPLPYSLHNGSLTFDIADLL